MALYRVPLFLMAALVVGCPSGKPPAAPSLKAPPASRPEAAVDPRDLNLPVPKVTPDQIAPTPTEVKGDEVTGQEGLTINPEWKEGADYFEFAICQKENPSQCQPSLEAPERFVQAPFFYHRPPPGDVVVHVRPCVTAFRSQSKDVCGAYGTTPAATSGRTNASVGVLLDERNEIMETLIAHCSAIRTALHDYKQSENHDPQLAKKFEEYLVQSTPEACAGVMVNAEAEALSEVAITKDTAFTPGTIAILTLGSAAVLSLAVAGFSHHKARHYARQVVPEAQVKLHAAEVAAQKKGFDPDQPAPYRLKNPAVDAPSGKIKSTDGGTDVRLKGMPGDHWVKARNVALGAAGLAVIAGAVATAFEAGAFGSGLVANDTPLSVVAGKLENIWREVKLLRSRLREIDASLAQEETRLNSGKPAVAAQHRQQAPVSASPAQNFSMIFASDPQLVWGRHDIEAGDTEAWERTGLETNQLHTLTMNRINELGSQYPKPQAVVINGDLTAFGHPWQWRLYERLYHKDHPEGVAERLTYPIFPGLGNHDYQNNVNDCWGHWSSIFSSKGNTCAKDSMKYIEKFVESQRGRLVGFDPGSLAYSWDTHGVHFVQLHNHPSYERSEIGVKPSLAWLRSDLEAAAKAGKKSILNFHIPEFSQELVDLADSHNVIAVFTGHFHADIGETPDVVIRGERQIPFLSCGSASYNRFLYVSFTSDFMRVTAVNSAKAHPEIVWEKAYPYPAISK